MGNTMAGITGNMEWESDGRFVAWAAALCLKNGVGYDKI